MDASDVRALIQKQIAGNKARINTHGCILAQCLIDPPELRTFLGVQEGDTWALWLVLKEHPDNDSGYKIAYDPDDDCFCLVSGNGPEDDFLVGYYGSFLTAFDAM